MKFRDDYAGPLALRLLEIHYVLACWHALPHRTELREALELVGALRRA